MASAQPPTADEKARQDNQLEIAPTRQSRTSVDEAKADRDLEHQLKSDYDELGLLKTAWKFRKAVLVCTMLCIAAAADGYQINLNGSIIANQGFVRKIGFPNAAGVYALNANYTALWGALQSLGQMIAMVFLNPISDRIGRKYTLYVLWVILLGSLLIETFVRNWQDWAGAKLLAGVGVGAIQMTLPVFITEWAPVNIRGAMIIAYGIWNTIGNFLAPVVLSITDKQDPLNYRIPILTQFAFLGIMLPIFLWLPETPSYFAAKGLHEQGMATLRRVNGKVPGYNVENEYAIVVNTIEEERRMKSDAGIEAHSTRDILRSYAACFKGVNAKRTLAAALPAIVQQCNGLSFLNIYAAFFFRQAGFANAFEITSILTAIKVVGVLACVLLADTVGRRRLIIFGGWWCSIMLLIVGAAGQNATTTPIRNLVIAAACLWSMGNSPLGSLGWTFVGEVPNQKLRARTAGLAAAGGVVFGLTFNTSVPIMLNASGANLGYNTAWIFLGLGVIANIFALFFIPETARRSPAELDELYEKRIPAWRMRGYMTDVQKSQRERLDRAGATTSAGVAGV